MKKFIPYIWIHRIHFMDKNYNNAGELYFLTKKGMHRFLKDYKEEAGKQELTWRIRKEQLWLWK